MREFRTLNKSSESPKQDIFVSALVNQIGDKTVSVEADMLSELNGLMGFGYRNDTDVIIDGEVDEFIFRENIAGEVYVEGKVDGALRLEMMGAFSG